ncbi:OmpA family protein [Stenotrophomonas sp. STK17_22]|uniref:OmpA family protein n=1 Tax=Stenotrophomonas sp. STK17_22 TaxID=3455201 RepID=UPI003F7D446D
MNPAISLLMALLLAGCASALPSPGKSGRQPINTGAQVINAGLPSPGQAKPTVFPAPVISRPAVPANIYQATSPASQAASVEPMMETDERLTIYFPPNGTEFKPDPGTLKQLDSSLPVAQRVDVVARTDADKPSAADEAVALKRALNAREYLIRRGVAASMIYIQYASAVDFAGDNSTAFGRSQNRRVELVIQ